MFASLRDYVSSWSLLLVGRYISPFETSVSFSRREEEAATAHTRRSRCSEPRCKYNNPLFVPLSSRGWPWFNNTRRVGGKHRRLAGHSPPAIFAKFTNESDQGYKGMKSRMYSASSPHKGSLTLFLRSDCLQTFWRFDWATVCLELKCIINFTLIKKKIEERLTLLLSFLSSLSKIYL